MFDASVGQEGAEAVGAEVAPVVRFEHERRAEGSEDQTRRASYNGYRMRRFPAPVPSRGPRGDVTM